MFQMMCWQSSHRGGLTKFKADKPAEVFCHYCHRLVPEGFQTVDHKQAVLKGGTNFDDNLVWACELCNQLKGSMDYNEFRLRRKLTNDNLRILEEAAYWTHQQEPAFEKFRSQWQKFQNRITII